MKKITCIQNYIIDKLIEDEKRFINVNAVNITASLR